jgi:PIN domain nuclease of toxin-antitoxin system
LKLKVSLLELKSFLIEKGIFILEFDFYDLDELQKLPFYHQDPFDRLIIAQAKTKNLEIVTDDEQIKKYF